MTSNGRLGAETQQLTRMPDEQKDFARFLAGEPEERDAEYEEWYDQIRSWAPRENPSAESGSVAAPLTDYQPVHIRMGSSRRTLPPEEEVRASSTFTDERLRSSRQGFLDLR